MRLQPTRDHTGAFAIAARVIHRADRIPADEALRRVFVEERPDPELQREAARNVFRYYRWFGWLSQTQDLRANLESAVELDERFRTRPASFTDAELIERAVPK